MKKIILSIFSLLLIGFVSAQCVIPYDDMVITEDTTFCNGRYFLPNGISIEASNITLDCNNSKLVGNGTGSYYNTGIDMFHPHHYNIVKNCEVSNYTQAFFVKSRGNNFEGNVASDSVWSGFRIFGSNNIFDNNSALNNSNNGFEFSQYSSNNLVINNLAMYNGGSGSSHSSGIMFEHSAKNNTAINNTLINNYGGIKVSGSDNIKIIGNIINNNKNGLTLSSGSNILIKDNIFDSNGYTNLMLIFNKNSTNIKVINNKILKTPRGIFLWGFSNAIITKNIITSGNFISTPHAISVADESSYYDPSRNNSIWANDIYIGEIYDKNESNNIYCVNGVGNNYFDGATGPACPNIDDDDDGVLDDEDKCPDTEEEQIIYGCSCNQILELKPGKDISNKCSPGIIKTFTKGLGWAQDLF